MVRLEIPHQIFRTELRHSHLPDKYILLNISTFRSPLDAPPTCLAFLVKVFIWHGSMLGALSASANPPSVPNFLLATSRLRSFGRDSRIMLSVNQSATSRGISAYRLVPRQLTEDTFLCRDHHHHHVSASFFLAFKFCQRHKATDIECRLDTSAPPRQRPARHLDRWRT